MEKRELTSRQASILAFISQHMIEQSTAPTIREIMRKFGLKSPNAVVGHLVALERKGVLTHTRGQARAYIPRGARVVFDDPGPENISGNLSEKT